MRMTPLITERSWGCSALQCICPVAPAITDVRLWQVPVNWRPLRWLPVLSLEVGNQSAAIDTMAELTTAAGEVVRIAVEVADSTVAATVEVSAAAAEMALPDLS